VPVGGGGEPGQDTLGRVDPGGRLERAGQRAGAGDAVEPEGPVLVDPGIAARHVPASRVGDEAVGVQDALAAAAVGGGVPDRERPAVAHRVGDGKQHGAVGGVGAGRRRGEGERPEQGVEPAGEPVRQHPPDLGRRRLARGARARQQP
jgi:hypothetical protein